MVISRAKRSAAEREWAAAGHKWSVAKCTVSAEGCKWSTAGCKWSVAECTFSTEVCKWSAAGRKYLMAGRKLTHRPPYTINIYCYIRNMNYLLGSYHRDSLQAGRRRADLQI